MVWANIVPFRDCAPFIADLRTHNESDHLHCISCVCSTFYTLSCIVQYILLLHMYVHTVYTYMYCVHTLCILYTFAGMVYSEM